MIPALLALEDGSIFRGQSIGVAGQSVGEVVFNTAMTGYQEILTDPSYAKQIVTLTYPQIGNTGVTPEDVESDRLWGAGLVIRALPKRVSNWRAKQSLPDYLQDAKMVAIAGVDTRRLTRHIQKHGAMAGCILTGATATDQIDAEVAIVAAKAFPGLQGMDLAKEVSRTKNDTWQQGVWSLEDGYADVVPAADAPHVVAYDFGVKNNILRLLADKGARLTIVPATTPAAEVLALKPDGVFLSNGPGDPEPCDYAVTAIQTLLEERIPMFGICLGHQLLALASGAKSVKMPHGHHGANHPVQDLATGVVMITSQNHGFAIDADNLPDCLETTHLSLFDGTVQGLKRTDRPAFGFQGHPEASPGPQDCQHLFDEFMALIETHRA